MEWPSRLSTNWWDTSIVRARSSQEVAGGKEKQIELAAVRETRSTVGEELEVKESELENVSISSETVRFGEVSSESNLN